VVVAKQRNILDNVNLMEMVEGNMGAIFWCWISKIEPLDTILLNSGSFHGTNPILPF
jgi:hypothetical protein